MRLLRDRQGVMYRIREVGAESQDDESKEEEEEEPESKRAHTEAPRVGEPTKLLISCVGLGYSNIARPLRWLFGLNPYCLILLLNLLINPINTSLILMNKASFFTDE